MNKEMEGEAERDRQRGGGRDMNKETEGDR